MKKILLFIFVLVAIAAFVYKINSRPAEAPQTAVESDPYTHAEIKIGDAVFDAYVSDTEALQEKGLSGFPGLGNDEAMLFIFPASDIYGFWMKDMLFSIDLLWLDEDFKVVSFQKDLSPDTYPEAFYPTGPALYAIEFAAGTLDRIGVKEGDMISVSGGK